MKGIISRRRIRNTALPGNPGRVQTITPRLRQTDDLLPAQHTHAGRHSGHSDHHHA